MKSSFREKARRANIGRFKEWDDQVRNQVSDDACPEPVERLEFDDIWKRLLNAAGRTQIRGNWSKHIPCTFQICRVNNHGGSLADTGWVTSAHEEDDHERLSTVEIDHRL